MERLTDEEFEVLRSTFDPESMVGRLLKEHAQLKQENQHLRQAQQAADQANTWLPGSMGGGFVW